MNNFRTGLTGWQSLIRVWVVCLLAVPSAVADEWSLTLEPSLKWELAGGGSIASPAEGLWSIGCGWKDNAAETISYGDPETSTTRGEWTILSGTVETADGRWEIQDQYRPSADGLVQAKRRWKYQGQQPSGPVVLSVEFQVDRGESEAPLRTFLPGILYFGNPSGTRIDADRVPTWNAKPGAEARYEEHRYPLPLVSVEQDNGFVAALHSKPSLLPHGARDDLWWSLGIVENATGTKLSLQSGPVASNGNRGVVKALQTKFLPYPDAHLVAVPPGTVIEKEFYLQLATNDSIGHGFRHPLWASIDLFDPIADRSMPRPVDVVAAKIRDTFARWYEDDQCRGFRTRPPQAQPWFMMGWADRAEVPGHTLLALDLTPLTSEPDRWKKRAAESLDFLVSSPTQEGNRQGDFSIVYDYHQHKWLPRRNPLSQAQALNAIADAIGVATGRRADQVASPPVATTVQWKAFLHSALSQIADRTLAANWHPVSTNEAFAIAPLVKGSQILDDDRLMQAATKIADHTITRHITMREPYWGGTLDAKCEDKEGAWAALQGFAAMYRQTKDQKYLDAAVHAADVCLSYLYVWDVELPPGRLADHGLKTRGWTGVSVQNQHVDVFGVIFTPQLWQLGQWTGDKRYHQLAKLMFVSCGQMTDLPTGVQGEQLFQTNFQQHNAGDQVEGMRGGYSEEWNIYWISAHFLTAAAGLETLGVDWKDF